MRVLVTGDAGQAGRHVRKAAETAGHEVTGCDPAAGGYDARILFRNGTTRYDLVVHCAAVVGGRAVIDGNPLAQAVNLELDAAMFAWAARTKPGRVVYLSSSAAYPVALQHRWGAQPLREDDVNLAAPRLPDALYGWMKLTGERLAVLARDAGVPVTVVRPFSGYAGDQGEDYPFGAFAGRARRREDPFDVWGDGSQVRDFIHLDDVAAAILMLAADGVDGPLNLGTGIGTSMLELARAFCDQAGYAPQIRCLPAQPRGVAHRVADTTVMGEHWKPQITLADGIAESLAHP